MLSRNIFTTTGTGVYPWHDSHFISISDCEVWGLRAEVQVFKGKKKAWTVEPPSLLYP